ncbi:MAG: glycosyltransferase family 8 protein [Bacteroidales bacterium]|jgi:lipopolysaccharide biosynthesis glycosyltransferase|nr:glycosyltransferase family 8 protein [Bacteroidales bacterium]
MADELKKNTSNIIPVVFATDDNYFPYMAVSIQSIMENADASQAFKIYVLCQTLSDDYKQLLQEQIEPYKNFSIAYVDVTGYFKDYTIKTAGIAKYTINTLFRLLIPDIFSEYRYVLWIDVDTVCLANIADFWNNTDENRMLKCVRDIGTLTILRQHAREIGLTNIRDYFSAGVLVFNVELFKRNVTFEDMIKLYLQKQFPYNDQDLLNIFCQNKVQYASMNWNVICGKCKVYNDPKIIHYVWDKPWKSFFISKRGRYFWQYAEKTPFYNIIVHKSEKKSVKNIMPLIKYSVMSFFARFLAADKMVK